MGLREEVIEHRFAMFQSCHRLPRSGLLAEEVRTVLIDRAAQDQKLKISGDRLKQPKSSGGRQVVGSRIELKEQ